MSQYEDIKEPNYFQNVREPYQFEPEYRSKEWTDEEWARMERQREKQKCLVRKQIRTAQSE